MLWSNDIRVGFPSRPDFLGPVSLRVDAGDCCGIVGPNGAGKSTLLRLMAGLLKPKTGRIELDSDALAALSSRERARKIAFLPQRVAIDADFTVREVVLMGRFPHRSMGLFDSAEDNAIVESAMADTQTLEFADRPMETLSGGEAQRVHIAAALAQQPRVLLLDEPTASLDIQHQLAVFEILRGQAAAGIAVVVVTHDVNFAADFCNKVLLLDNGKAVACGPPAEVISPEMLAPVYGVELAAVAAPGPGPRNWIIPRVNR
jgi:iron complex transport system ATP-binding protein